MRQSLLWVIGKSRKDADLQIEKGFKNFLCSIECAILHFCIREYLCLPGQTYYLTDLSKGAIRVREAVRKRRERYERWYPLLQQELTLVTRSDSAVFVIGKEAEQFLTAQEWKPNPVKLAATLVHYSGQAAKHHMDCIKGKEDQFDLLAASLRLERMVETLQAVQVEAGWPAQLRQDPRYQLHNATLTDSRKARFFWYRTPFETWR